MVTCTKCGVENVDGSSNCRMCGNSLVAGTRHCVSCGRSIDWHTNVCPYCGHDFRVVLTEQVAKTVSTGLRIVLYVLSVLFPIVGIIVGIIFLTRDSPDEKHVGKICLILGIVSILLTVVSAAVLYMMVLGFAHDIDSVVTPTTSLTRMTVTDGYKFTFLPVNGDVAWSDVSIVLSDEWNAVYWSPSSGDLDDSTPIVHDYGALVLAPVTVSLSILDIAGNGRIDMGDSFTLTSSPSFSVTTSYTVKVIYEPTDFEMCSMYFSG